MHDDGILQLVVNGGVPESYFLYDFSVEGNSQNIADIIPHPSGESMRRLNNLLKNVQDNEVIFSWLRGLITYGGSWPLIFLREGFRNLYEIDFFKEEHVIGDPSFENEIKARLIVDAKLNNDQWKFDAETAKGYASGLYISSVAPISVALSELLIDLRDPELKYELGLEIADKGRRR